MTPTTAPELETVVLKGGLVVSLAALQLGWRLEARGLHLRLAADGGLIVGPRSRITHEEDAAIRQYRDELLALVRYCEVML